MLRTGGRRWRLRRDGIPDGFVHRRASGRMTSDTARPGSGRRRRRRVGGRAYGAGAHFDSRAGLSGPHAGGGAARTPTPRLRAPAPNHRAGVGRPPRRGGALPRRAELHRRSRSEPRHRQRRTDHGLRSARFAADRPALTRTRRAPARPGGARPRGMRMERMAHFLGGLLTFFNSGLQNGGASRMRATASRAGWPCRVTSPWDMGAGGIGHASEETGG